MEAEIRKCNECGEEWRDDGDPDCFFCDSNDTEIVMEKALEE